MAENQRQQPQAYIFLYESLQSNPTFSDVFGANPKWKLGRNQKNVEAVRAFLDRIDGDKHLRTILDCAKADNQDNYVQLQRIICFRILESRNLPKISRNIIGYFPRAIQLLLGYSPQTAVTAKEITTFLACQKFRQNEFWIFLTNSLEENNFPAAALVEYLLFSYQDNLEAQTKIISIIEIQCFLGKRCQLDLIRDNDIEEY